MTTSFAIGTIVVILLIFSVFFYGAHRADKVVEAKAAAKRAEMAKTGSKTKKM
ncbi:MAG TPA: hypothetical protein VHY08_14490 [Bacillota bacterium]|nr:hypothetical protein [Bacillota bacterium]